jgi:triphosphoribosyl-dephospho-CoA synthetase
MTKQELGELLKETSKRERAEFEEFRKKGGPIGLDGEITSKYRKIYKELFARYEREKED